MGALLLEMLRPMLQRMGSRYGTTLTVQASRPSTFHKDDMMVRLELVTECEHGFNGQHYPLGGDHSFCSGGSRIPLDPKRFLVFNRDENDNPTDFATVQDVLDALEQP